MSRYRALLVGNSTFPHDPDSLQTLIGPPNDIDQLAASLADPESGLFLPEDITTLRDRASSEVRRELAKFFGRASRDDVLLFYYSGHGRLDIRNVLYLCTLDAETDLLEATSVSSTWVQGLVAGTAATNTVLMIDCCHSGAFKGNDIARALMNPKSYVMTSCRQNDLANDASAAGRTSMFTGQVVDGLSRAAAHGRLSEHLTIEELFGYVRDGLETHSKQVPQFFTHGDGDLPIARRSAVGAHRETPGVTLKVSEALLDLGEVALDDVLPLERVYVVARRADGRPARWTARTSAAWVDLTPRTDPERLELGLRPDPGGGRANVEIRNEDTGDVVTVRIVMRLRKGPLSPVTSYDGVAGSVYRSTGTAADAGPPLSRLRGLLPTEPWFSGEDLTTHIDGRRLTGLTPLGRGGMSEVFKVGGSIPEVPGSLAYKRLLPNNAEPQRTRMLNTMRRSVALRAAMTPAERREVDAVTVWPLTVVRDGGEDVGVVMRCLPDAFFIDTNDGPRVFEWQLLSASPDQARANGYHESRSAADQDLVRLALAASLAYAVEVVHRPRGGRRLVFGDLSLRTVAVATDPPRILLMDCDGIADLADEERLQPNTPFFVPPEIQKKQQALQDQVTDVYKLGLCIIRGLASGRGSTQLMVPTSPLVRPGLLDREGVDLLQRAVGADRSRRPTAEDIKDYLVYRVRQLSQ